MSDFENRLAKNAKHFFKWAKRQHLTAFRLYDRDLPEVPAVVDFYNGYLHLSLYPRRNAEQLEATVRAEASKALEVPAEKVFAKTHRPRVRREGQYERLGSRAVTTVVDEGAAKLEVNLSDYLDTGLFIDHRNTRLQVGREANSRRMLHLFGYAGAFTLHAALGGAETTTTVDLSSTYGDWTRRNLGHNGLSEGPRPPVVTARAVGWLQGSRETFELIVVDPPSFSASKKASRFDVQADHRPLLEDALARLAKGGILYFSTNHQGFELDPQFQAEELTPRSLPEDCRTLWHRCWRFTG